MGGSGYDELDTTSSSDEAEDGCVGTKNEHLPFVEALSEISDKISEGPACPKSPQHKFQKVDDFGKFLQVPP